MQVYLYIKHYITVTKTCGNKIARPVNIDSSDSFQKFGPRLHVPFYQLSLIICETVNNNDKDALLNTLQYVQTRSVVFLALHADIFAFAPNHFLSPL